MRKLTNTAIIIFGMLLLSKILGFSRELVLAYKYGTGEIVDAFNVSSALPNVLFAVFASGLSQSYIPVLSRIGEKKRQSFFNNIFTIVFIASLLLSAACFLIAPQLTSILAPGFNEKARNTTIYFIKIIVWLLPFYTSFTIISAHLQYHEYFILPYFCDYIIVNVSAIIAIFFSREDWLAPLMSGYVISMVGAEIITFLYFSNKIGHYRFEMNLCDDKFRELLKLAIPLGISVMANQVNAATDKMFASMLVSGTTSALGYANRIQSLFLTLTTTIFISLCFPRINKAIAEGKESEGYYYIRKAFSLSLFFAIPFSLTIICYASDIVKALFEHGAFNDDSTLKTAECLRYYAIGIVFYALCELESKTLAANLKQKLILKNTVIAVCINIFLDVVLVKRFAHVGLALATSITGILLFLLFLYDIKQNGQAFLTKSDLLESYKILLSAFISIGSGLAVSRFFSVTRYGFAAILTFSTCLYFFINYVLKTSIFLWVAKLIKSRGNTDV